MSAPSTSDQLLELACKSGLLDPQRLQAYLRQRRAAGPLPEVPRALANALVRDGLLTRFQVEQLLLGKWRHLILSGKYKILGPLGSGGMGQVFLCEHLVMRHRVAVKVLPVARSGSPASLERFHREARAVAQLRHPNIVGGHDVDRDGKVHFLVMEYIDGSNFRKIVKERGPLTPLRASHYVRQAALGLQHAHEAGLVHRDVKPSNLLLDRAGTVKVLDLGLARFFHDDADDLSIRHVESPLGTADYMAPEQALDSHTADVRADIYSLGATFYFLLTGQSRPREGTTPEKKSWPQGHRPRPIRDVRPEVPEGLAAVIDRMLAREPADRYQTPAEVAEALVPWTQTPIPPPPPEEMPGLDPPARDPGRTEAAQGSLASLTAPAASPTTVPADTQNGAPSPSAWGSSSPTLVVATQPGAIPASQPRIRLEATAPQSTPPPSADPDGSTDTARPGPALPRGKASGSSPGRRRAAHKRRRPWVVAAVVAALLAGAGAFAVYSMTAAPDPTPPERPSGATRPAGAGVAPRLSLLVPAYFYPEGEGLAQWGRLLGSPAAAATVVIANPDSGPGKAADANYVKVLARARQKGVTAIGYVSTKYAARPLREVKGDVDRWVQLYPGIRGIFIDEQASTADQVLYYAALYEYVRKDRGLDLVVSNPGTVCAEEYLGRPTADVGCLAEAPKDFISYRHPAWAVRYPPRRFAALVCKTETPERMREYILEMAHKRIGYCYVTDGGEPNPWGRLPRYWEAEAAAVQQANEKKAP